MVRSVPANAGHGSPMVECWAPSTRSGLQKGYGPANRPGPGSGAPRARFLQGQGHPRAGLVLFVEVVGGETQADEGEVLAMQVVEASGIEDHAMGQAALNPGF